MSKAFPNIEKCLNDGIDEVWCDPDHYRAGFDALRMANVELAAMRKLLEMVSSMVEANTDHAVECASSYVEGENIGEPCDCHLQPLSLALSACREAGK